MSFRPPDPFLEKGRIRPFIEHIRIIVALNKDGIKGRDNISETSKNVSEIGHDAEPLLSGGDDKDCSISTVMGCGYGTDHYVFNVDHPVRRKMSHIVKLAKGMPPDCRVIGLFSNVQGKTIFSLKDACMPDMIAMVMGNDHSVHIADVPSPCRQFFFCLNAVDACIKEESYTPGLDIDAVTIAAGL